MDLLESFGSGGAGGVIGSILFILGWNKKMERLQNEKQSVKDCNRTHDMLCGELKGMREDIQHLTGRIDTMMNAMSQK